MVRKRYDENGAFHVDLAELLASEGFQRQMKAARDIPLSSDWMRVAPGADAAIWRPWNRETGEL